MRHVEASAPTVEEAIDQALQALGADPRQVNIEVLKEGKEGVLGLGREDAIVRVTLRAEDDEGVCLAQEILTELLSHLELSADIEAEDGAMADDDSTTAPVVLNISGDELGVLIGRHGQTLAALQYILRLMVAQRIEAPVSLVLDVNGYKKRRYDSLRTLARHIAEQVAVSQRPFALEPMPAYERRIIHMALARHPSVMTQSVGFGDARKITVVPKDKHYHLR